MTRFETITEILLAAWIFVSGYFILIAASVICEAQLIDVNSASLINPNTPGLLAPAPIVVNPYPQQPLGYGYSVVTTERVRPDYWMQYMGERNSVVHETTTSVVPNNYWGQPIHPIVPMPYPYYYGR